VGAGADKPRWQRYGIPNKNEFHYIHIADTYERAEEIGNEALNDLADLS